LPELKLQTAISFGIILPSQYTEGADDINPEDRAAKKVEFTQLTERDQLLVEGLQFVYLDP